MSKHLISTVDTYRVDSEIEAKQLIEDTKLNTVGELSKYISERKEAKAKGEVIDEYYKVTLTQIFNSIKEPVNDVSVNYDK